MKYSLCLLVSSLWAVVKCADPPSIVPSTSSTAILSTSTNIPSSTTPSALPNTSSTALSNTSTSATSQSSPSPASAPSPLPTATVCLPSRQYGVTQKLTQVRTLKDVLRQSHSRTVPSLIKVLPSIATPHLSFYRSYTQPLSRLIRLKQRVYSTQTLSPPRICCSQMPPMSAYRLVKSLSRLYGATSATPMKSPSVQRFKLPWFQPVSLYFPRHSIRRAQTVTPA